MTTTTTESEALAVLLERVAKSVKKQFRNCDFSDLHQEAWLWAIEHKRVVKANVDNEGYVWTAARNHVARYARQWLADTAGYQEDDQFHYSIPQLKTLLVKAFTPEWMVQGTVYDKDPGGTNGVSDPAEAWAMVADVKTGYDRLSKRDKDLLWQMLGEPGDPKEIARNVAASYGIDTHVLNARVWEALNRLRKHLGGAKLRD